MKKVYVGAFILLGLVALVAPVAAQKNTRPDFREPSFTLTSPRPGATLKAGARVVVAWDLLIDQAIIDNNWAEMELFVVDANGLLLRITPQLSVTTKTFEWTVPNVNTSSAKIMLQVGIEGEGDFYELPQLGTFSIRSKVLQPLVFVNSPARTPRAGENMEITWISDRVEESKGFDVMISYDRGAHFYKAGTTTESRFSLPIDENFSGAVTVQIIGRTADGTKVASLLTPHVTFRVKSKDQQ